MKFHTNHIFLPEDKLIMGDLFEYNDISTNENCKKSEKSGEKFFEIIVK